ncbi:MAG: CvpA family protein [Proteobacteria bacterium]|nr:CvpA family protein [Pseudomonadota bacterium]
MTTVDYIIIGAVVLSAIIGMARGFLREAMSVLTWIVALIVAWHFSSWLEPHLGGSLSEPHVRTWAARVLMVVGVLVIGAAVSAVLTHFVRLSIFSGTDRLLGFLFGALRAAVVLGVFVMLGETLKLTGEPWWRQSQLIPYGASVANALRTLVGEERLHYLHADPRVHV